MLLDGDIARSRIVGRGAGLRIVDAFGTPLKHDQIITGGPRFVLLQ